MVTEMRAVLVAHPGPPEVLQVAELPDPEPGPGQVVVAVEVATTTFVETQTRAGVGPRPVDPAAFPLVLGNGRRAPANNRAGLPARAGGGPRRHGSPLDSRQDASRRVER